MASMRLPGIRRWGNLSVPCKAPSGHLRRRGEVWGRFFASEVPSRRRCIVHSPQEGNDMESMENRHHRKERPIDSPTRTIRENVLKVFHMCWPPQRARPNSYRLMKSPSTRSCICSVLEKHSVRRTNRLIRVRRLMCLLSIFWVFSFPT